MSHLSLLGRPVILGRVIALGEILEVGVHVLRTILAAITSLLLLGQPTLAQQNPAQQQSPMERSPELNPSAGPDAAPIAGPSPAENQQGERNPAAASASGCGTTDAQLAKTPVHGTPCPEAGADPTPGSGVNK